MALVLASAHLSDDEFVAAIHTFQITPTEFRHADHLRLAWIYLHRFGWETALASVQATIQAFAAYYGVAHLYHETITTAWVTLVASHPESTFEEFLQNNEGRLNGDLLHQYYSPELLASEEAKAEAVPPNRMVLPAVAERVESEPQQ